MCKENPTTGGNRSKNTVGGLRSTEQTASRQRTGKIQTPKKYKPVICRRQSNKEQEKGCTQGPQRQYDSDRE